MERKSKIYLILIKGDRPILRDVYNVKTVRDISREMFIYIVVLGKLVIVGE